MQKACDTNKWLLESAHKHSYLFRGLYAFTPRFLHSHSPCIIVVVIKMTDYKNVWRDKVKKVMSRHKISTIVLQSSCAIWTNMQRSLSQSGSLSGTPLRVIESFPGSDLSLQDWSMPWHTHAHWENHRINTYQFSLSWFKHSRVPSAFPSIFRRFHSLCAHAIYSTCKRSWRDF